MTAFRAAAVFAFLAVSLAGCMMDIADPDQIKKMPTDQLCEDYYFGRQPSVDPDTSWAGKQADIKKELDKRHAIAPGDWSLIEQGRIQPGMSECALKAAWGHPLRVDHATTGNGGTSAHYTYSLVRSADVADGKVTGFRY